MIENHDDIVAKCLEIDELAKGQQLVVYYLSSDKHTFKLITAGIYWNMLAENERYCMVKYGNYYLTREEALAKIAMIQAVEEDEDVMESRYMSYLEAGGSGEPLSYKEWRKTQ